MLDSTFPQSLGKKILFQVVLASLVLTIILTIIQVYFDYNDQIKGLTNKLASMGKTYSGPISQALWSYNDIQIEMLGESILSQPNIASVSIINDKNQNVLTIGTKEEVIEPIEVIFPLTIKSKNKVSEIGKLIVTGMKDKIWSDVQKRFFIHLLSQLIIIMMISFIILYIVNRMIINPLKKISKQTEALSLTEQGTLLVEGVIFHGKNSKSKEMLSIFHSLNLMKEKIDNLFILREKLTVEYVRNANLTSLGVLASGIAHDFNNILQGVYSAHVLIEKRINDDEKIISLLNKASLLTQRGQEIVNGILLFSRNKSAEKEEVDLGESVLEVLRLGQLLTFKNYNISLEDNSSSAMVSAVRIQLFQVFTNLIKNACDATDVSSGHIKITIDNDPEHKNIIIKISDDGMGIEENELAHIFDPFYTTKNVGQGTGLGLSIVHGVINDFNGTIIANSEPKIGTEFKITLPLINS